MSNISKEATKAVAYKAGIEGLNDLLFYLRILQSQNLHEIDIKSLTGETADAARKLLLLSNNASGGLRYPASLINIMTAEIKHSLMGKNIEEQT